jgi:hypothetical protein
MPRVFGQTEFPTNRTHKDRVRTDKKNLLDQGSNVPHEPARLKRLTGRPCATFTRSDNNAKGTKSADRQRQGSLFHFPVPVVSPFENTPGLQERYKQPELHPRPVVLSLIHNCLLNH